jgi:peptidoglycan/LPS O-acetylase OafA/YrhL
MSESGALRASGSGRMIQLDGLRAFAAVAVVAEHSLDERTIPWMNLGSLGVRLFFVLSGFLITGILLKGRASIDDREQPWPRVLGHFYARRSLRIFPLYYLAIAFSLLLALDGVRDLLPWFLAYATNIRIALTGDWPPSIRHFWTLGVEEQFYLVWPAIVLFTPRRYLMPVFLALIMSSPLARATTVALGAPISRYRPLPIYHMDALGLGALLALVREACTTATLARLRRCLPYVAFASVVFYAAAKVSARTGLTGEMFSELAGCVFTLSFVWLVDRGSSGFGGPLKKLLEWRPLTYLGEISYGLYVYHLMILEAGLAQARTVPALSTLIGPPGFQRFAVNLVITVIVASLSWRFFEKPLNDLKRYFTNAPREQKAVRGVAIPASTEGGVYSPVQG